MMCSPTLAIAAVGTAFSAFSQVQQANAQADAIEAQARDNQTIANYNADIAESNAELSANAATDAVRRGANEAADIRDRVRRINATGRAVQGSSGLLLDTGNFADVLDQNTVFGELNALTVQNNADREAFGFKVEEQSFTNQAAVTRAGGQAGVNAASASAANVRQGGFLNAGSTLVTGAVNFGKLGGFGDVGEGGQIKTRFRSQ